MDIPETYCNWCKSSILNAHSNVVTPEETEVAEPFMRYVRDLFYPIPFRKLQISPRIGSGYIKRSEHEDGKVVWRTGKGATT